MPRARFLAVTLLAGTAMAAAAAWLAFSEAEDPSGVSATERPSPPPSGPSAPSDPSLPNNATAQGTRGPSPVERERHNGAVAVEVLEPDGKTPAAAVLLGAAYKNGESLAPLSKPVRADAQGRAQFEGLPEGIVYIYAERAPWSPRAVEVRKGKTQPLQLTLRPGYELEIRVISADDLPVAGAEVKLGCSFSPELSVGRTNSEGKVILKNVEPVVGLMASARAEIGGAEFAASNGFWSLPGARKSLDFRLPVHLDGMAVDATSERSTQQVLTSQAALLDRLVSTRMSNAVVGESAASLVDHWVQANELVLSRDRVRMSLNRVLSLPLVMRSEMLEDGSPVPTFSLSARVVAEGGRTLPPLSIRAHGTSPQAESWLQQSAETDASGRFVMRGLPQPDVQLEVCVPLTESTAPAVFWISAFAGGGEELTITLPHVPAPARVVGSLADDRGFPASTAFVMLAPADGTNPIGPYEVNPITGAFAAGPICPGRYRAQFADARGSTLETEPFEVTEGQRLELPPAKLPPIGRILWEFSETAAPQNAAAWFVDEQGRTVGADAQCSAIVAAGPWSAFLSSPGFASLGSMVSVPADGAVFLPAQLRPGIRCEIVIASAGERFGKGTVQVAVKNGAPVHRETRAEFPSLFQIDLTLTEGEYIVLFEAATAAGAGRVEGTLIVPSAGSHTQQDPLRLALTLGR
ncbi:MAG: hypothetical protein JNJ88_09640 [Planctomycetes bacterium]|nr:hypothetical protein [Planctomycetota bacterium]